MLVHHIAENRKVFLVFPPFLKRDVGSGGIRTHASEETGALNQRCHSDMCFFFFFVFLVTMICVSA